jgi:drug/metabolite transporter (DMT)-like permease
LNAVPIDVIAIVLGAALLHAAWNAIAKGWHGSDSLVSAFAIAAGAAIVAAGMLLFLGWPNARSYPYVLASGIIHVGYFALLGLSYRLADYSAVYPITRGSAPLFTTLLGAALLGELYGSAMLAGIALLSAGVLGLGIHALRRGGLNYRGGLVAGANVCVIVAYTLVDGAGVRVSGNPGGYVALMMLLTGILLALVVIGFRGRAAAKEFSRNWLLGLVGGAMVMASYWAALWAMTKAPIGAVAALRETSVLFATLIATVVLREHLGSARIVSTIIVFLGLVCMRLA